MHIAVEQRPNDGFEQFTLGERVGGLVGHVALGAIGGMACYWIVSFGNTVGLFNQTEKMKPLVLSGMITLGLEDVLGMTYDIFLRVIKPTEDGAQAINNQSFFECFRSFVWNHLKTANSYLEKADSYFSRLAGIRSIKQIHLEKVLNRDLSLLEISRIAFFQQVHETAIMVLTLGLIATVGLEIVGSQLIIWLCTITFANGLINKILDAWKNKKVELAEIRAKSQLQCGS